jgi:hypothetical protein
MQIEASFRTAVFLLVFSVFLFDTSFAQSAKKPGATAGQPAIIITDGAQVYDKPDFDANILGRLAAGKTARVSKKKSGGMAKFYRIKVGKVTGYIADIDVKTAESSSEKPSRATKAKRSPKQASEKKRPEKDAPKEPLYFSRFIGLTLGTIMFKEGVSGVDSKDGLLVYGFRATGPDVLMESAVIDWSVLLHYGAPSYYDRLSSTKPSGFVLWTDALFLLPMFAKNDSMFYLGVGPLLMFSNFKVTNGGSPRDLTELNLGLSTALGWALRIDKLALRVEGKYFIEKRTYPGIELSLQSPL